MLELLVATVTPKQKGGGENDHILMMRSPQHLEPTVPDVSNIPFLLL